MLGLTVSAAAEPRPFRGLLSFLDRESVDPDEVDPDELVGQLEFEEDGDSDDQAI